MERLILQGSATVHWHQVSSSEIRRDGSFPTWLKVALLIRHMR